MVRSRIFIGNLATGTEKDDLRTVFGKYGEITSIDCRVSDFLVVSLELAGKVNPCGVP